MKRSEKKKKKERAHVQGESERVTNSASCEILFFLKSLLRS